MKINITSLLMSAALAAPGAMWAQDKADGGYTFTMQHQVPTTSVKNQSRSGTCWSFAAVSFIETELLRTKQGEFDISEMYFVHHAYNNKAQKYIRLHGAYHFGPGGQAHDVFDVLRQHGMVTESEYPGLSYGTENHQHGELNQMLKSMLEASLKKPNGELSEAWSKAIGAVLSTYLGPLPNAKNSPLSRVKFNPDDYVEITSYANYPFYQAIDLEIPDNWAHRLYHNVPLDELMTIMDYALSNGYSICWDGDVSERGFSRDKCVAVLPIEKLADMPQAQRDRLTGLSEKERMAKLYAFEGPVPEVVVDQKNRQRTFDNLTSTDDHLMHLTGIAVDQNGTRYFLTKNSWGETGPYKGYLYMSESFVKMKTVAIMVHKDAIPATIAKKMGLK